MTRPAPVRAVLRARRAVWQAAQVLDPARLRLRPAPAGSRIGLACVVRTANAGTVRRLLTGLPAGAAVRLWFLDGPPPADLDALTAGTGPANRFTLLNRLVGGLDPAARADGLVLADDDVRFVVGDVSRLVGTALAEGLDVYQPAHTALSHTNWPFTRRRALTLVRRTDFVEQGPLVGFSARAQAALLPLPEDLGMGWGVEVRWWEASRRHGLVQGFVDAAAVRHLTATAGAYDRGAEERQLAAELERAGLSDLRELHREAGRG